MLRKVKGGQGKVDGYKVAMIKLKAIKALPNHFYSFQFSHHTNMLTALKSTKILLYIFSPAHFPRAQT